MALRIEYLCIYTVCAHTFITFCFIAPSGPVVNLNSNIEGALVTIFWDAPEYSDCISGYIIEYNNKRETLDATVTSYHPEELEYCIQHEIKVAAIGSTNDSIGEFDSVTVEIGPQQGKSISNLK